METQRAGPPRPAGGLEWSMRQSQGLEELLPEAVLRGDGQREPAGTRGSAQLTGVSRAGQAALIQGTAVPDKPSGGAHSHIL